MSYYTPGHIALDIIRVIPCERVFVVVCVAHNACTGNFVFRTHRAPKHCNTHISMQTARTHDLRELCPRQCDREYSKRVMQSVLKCQSSHSHTISKKHQSNTVLIMLAIKTIYYYYTNRKTNPLIIKGLNPTTSVLLARCSASCANDQGFFTLNKYLVILY